MDVVVWEIRKQLHLKKGKKFRITEAILIEERMYII